MNNLNDLFEMHAKKKAEIQSEILALKEMLGDSFYETPNDSPIFENWRKLDDELHEYESAIRFHISK